MYAFKIHRHLLRKSVKQSVCSWNGIEKCFVTGFFISKTIQLIKLYIGKYDINKCKTFFNSLDQCTQIFVPIRVQIKNGKYLLSVVYGACVERMGGARGRSDKRVRDGRWNCITG